MEQNRCEYMLHGCILKAEGQQLQQKDKKERKKKSKENVKM